MDADVDQKTNVPVVVNGGDQETNLNKVDLLEGISSNEEVMGEQGTVGEVVTRVELDIACASEKLVNLNILMMHVATRESDFEAFASEREHILSDSAEKALEFDLLSGIVDSEVRELDKFMAILQADIINDREAIFSYKHSGEPYVEMEEQLLDSENSLKQSLEQISEIKRQSATFQRTLACLDGEENWTGDKGTGFSEDDQFFNMNTKIKMQTAEQQRHILRMLEKSLAREMDLEKKLTESRQNEQLLKLKLLSSEQDVLFYMEEEATDACERRFEAENAAEVLMGISKELLGRLQISQFNLNGSVQRETALRSKLDGSMEQLEVKENALWKLESSNSKVNDFLLAQTDGLKASLTEAEDNLILATSENFTLREKVSSLEKQLKEFEFQLLDAKASTEGNQEQHNALCSEINELENLNEGLKDKLSMAESRTESAESKCKLFPDTNLELNEGFLKSSAASSEKVDSLERQLRESDIQLQHAVAVAEACEEKQILLYSTIRDMENVIEGLKLNVSKADSRADSAEEKLIILSEANAGLDEELSFLRDRLECLEASLHQAEETKMATAKDIDIRAKVITNLVMQLAIERERLHQQIASLTMENRVMVVQLQQTKKDPAIVMSCDNRGSDKEFLFQKHDLTSVPCATEIKEEVTVLYATVPEPDKTQNVSVGRTEAEPVDLTSELGTVRRMDAGLLNYKHIFMAILIVLISAAAYFFIKQNQSF
ncbi:hypothetical protein Ddye_001736 [Dipteronia dyeriana]|uniref:WIT1/2 N-terminal helical bundle domain-containing protein n=1 Tax=Dipteronia dyeriana TaxID=168575 RepID=A0AAE0CTS1_9ROSI|nr:hypothetical protein Ddye_001736 [Dipteronia dyeriana]